MSIISNVNVTGATIAGGLLLFPAAVIVISARTQFFDHVKINSTSQLISRIFKLLQKLLKCFSGLTTSVSFVSALFASYPSSPSPIL